jgi:rubredoxin
MHAPPQHRWQISREVSMAKMMRCRVCGYVLPEGKIKDVCPACGYPKTVFEEHDEKISPRRKLILGLDLHPIAVHFPQVFATIGALFVAAAMVLKSPLAVELLTAARLFAILLPLSVLAAIVLGILDGKLRIKRLKTPYLLRKIVAAIILQVLSLIVCVLVLRSGLTAGTNPVVLLLLVGCIACEVVLGRTGGRLMCVRVRG